MRNTGGWGAVRVGYREAVALGNWELASQPPDVCELTAQVVSYSPLWLTQRPLDLVLYVGDSEWTWPDVAVDVDAVVSTRSLKVIMRGFPRVDRPASRA